MKTPLLYLASSSPRRRMLLTQAGLNIKVIRAEVDEATIRGESARDMVLRLAVAKAERGMEGVKRTPAAIIAADTTVVAPNGKTILGKPRNAAEARRMLKSIQGKEHIVFTAYCILLMDKETPHLELARVVKTKVKIRKLNAKEIAWYVNTGEPMDKAGAYGAQGIGASFIESIHGSYSNVVGLPLTEVIQDLQELGIKWV